MMKNGFRQFLWVAVPKISGAGLQLGLNLLLVRYFGPEQFGMIAVCLTIIILSDAVLGSAFDVAVLRHAPLHETTDRVRSLQFQQAGLLLKPAFAIIAILPLILANSQISYILFHQRTTPPVLYITVIAVFGLLILRSIQAHFQVSSKFRGYGILDIGHNTVRYGGTAFLLWIGAATPMRVVGLYAAAPSIISLVLLATLARPLITAPVSLDAVRQVLTLIKSYLPTAAIGSVTSRVDLFFVSSLGGVAQAGIFAAAQTLILVPQLIGMYMGVVFAPRIMPLYEAGKLRPVYNRFLRYAFIAAGAGYLLALATMNQFVIAVLPESFRKAAPIALILLPMGLAALVNFPWTVSFLMFMRPQFLLKFDLVGLPVLSALYYLVMPHYGPMGAAFVTSGYAIVKTVTMQTLAQHLLKQSNTGTPVEQEVAAPKLQLVEKVS